MSDKILYQQIRKLVKEQKQKTASLDIQRQDFAQQYCRMEMMKKKQLKHKQGGKINHLFKNFKNVQSYINIMDIIRNLPIEITQELQPKTNSQVKQTMPQIIPKSLQVRMKQKLGPMFNQKYQEQASKRKQVIEKYQSKLNIGNNMVYQGSDIIRQMESTINNDTNNDKLELIDVLRKDIKMKEVYYIEKRFDDEIKDLEKVPTKLQNTKIFHKICSYLHMILEQEHRQKWASRQDKNLRQARRQQSKLIRLSRTAKNSPDDKQKMTRTSCSRFYSPMKILQQMKTPEMVSSFSQTDYILQSRFLKNNKASQEQDEKENKDNDEMNKKNKPRKQFVKQNFTFRKRNIKANLMVKINQFVDNVNNLEKKNEEVSKKYAKVFQSLSEQYKSSYSRFQKQQIAQTEDIEQMKKYLDNTLSRNKKDLKKFHRK